jgi:poly(A) polymerase
MDSLYLANSNARAAIALEALLQRPAVRSLLDVLNKDGEEARLIGGAVRDCLMGRLVGDIDIATTALPALVIDRVTAMGWKAVPTGLEHGTITVVIEGIPFEVTTLRRDVSTNGRHAKVMFSRDFAQDALRRDFTINAMSISIDGIVHDYGTGREDARLARIRFMGDPETRIREDYLRILRFFRFHASHGLGEPEALGLAACASQKQGLTQLSRERIRQELFKLLLARGAVQAVMAMEKTAVWDFLLPGFSVAVSQFESLTALEPFFLDQPTNPVRRLAALLGSPSTADAVGMAELLRLSRKEETQLAHILQNAPVFMAATPDPGVFAQTYLMAGPDASIDALLVCLARSQATAAQATHWLNAVLPVLHKKPTMPFRNIDFSAVGIPAGPERSAFIREATQRWLEAGFPSDMSSQKAILAAFALEYTKR